MGFNISDYPINLTHQVIPYYKSIIFLPIFSERPAESLNDKNITVMFKSLNDRVLSVLYTTELL